MNFKKAKFACRLVCMLLALLMAALPLSACKKQEPTDPVDSHESSDSAQSSAADSTAAPAKDVYYNVLSGEECSKEQASVRPLAVMINNISASLPQVGLSKADIIYECEAEGTITRLLAVFSHYADITEAIGSIRSSREYFIDFAANHDAIYIHAGGSTEAYKQLASRKIDHIDGLSSNAFYRDKNRRAMGMAVEHTLVSTGEKLANAVKEKGFRQQLSDGYTAPFLFAHNGKVTPSAGDAKNISTKYSTFQYSGFNYDEKTGKYLRTEFGKPHVDANTGEQLSFENVIIIFCKYTYTGDAKNHIMVDTVGSGEGYWCSNGKYEKISWSKTSQDTPMALKDAKGNPLTVNEGKSFITVMDTADYATVTLN